MYQKVESWVDMAIMDHKILDFWKENNCFEKLRDIIKGKPPWSFLDGPITANNPMAVHHAWGRSLKDAFQRYWAMNRRDLRYQNGFDCQGLWVEVEVEKELGFKTKKDIEAYGIDKFVYQCKARVQKYSRIITEQSIRLGYWMDWGDSYYTMSEENNYTIWTFLKKCWQRGLIYKGHDVMPWCHRCGTGISQHEMHEGYKEIIHESVVVRFPIRGRRKEALLIWTTTPWTLAANVAVAVHPDLDYVKVQQGEWIYYLAKTTATTILDKQAPYRILDLIKGKDLVHLSYDGPFDDLPAQQSSRLNHPVIVWDEVTDNEGTGIVHIAPGCGREDYQLGLAHSLDIIAPIDEEGLFLAGYDNLSGKHAADIPETIFSNLVAKGLLYRIEPYTHSYPHCWRCSEPLLFRLVEEWFIATDEWREDIMAITRKAEWIPAFGLDLELDWLKNMQDWMISKKRYWGLALPIWECGECSGFEVIGSFDELRERAVSGWDIFEGHTPHRPWIDAVKVQCPQCGAVASRIADVGNPWLDAGIVSYSTTCYNTDRAYWEKWIPADLVLECFPGQFRNWFYSLLAMGTIMENTPPFKTLVGHALVNDENGEEMHKSKGNAIPFEKAAENMGCDVIRWMFYRQELSRNLNFGYTAAKEIRGKFFNTLWNTYGFFTNYARLARWTPPGSPTPVEDRCDFDRWILSELQHLIHYCRQAYETYDLKHLVISSENFLETLSNGFVRHNRNRFWKVGNETDSAVAFETLYECLLTFIRLLAPAIPFVTEEIYQNLVRSHDLKAPESIHHTRYPKSDTRLMDPALTEAMDTVMEIIGLGLSARERARIKVRQPLSRLTVSLRNQKEVRAVERFTYVLKEFLNVKQIDAEEPGLPKPETPMIYVLKFKFKTIAKKLGKKTQSLKAYAGQHMFELTQKAMTGQPFEIALGKETVMLGPQDFFLEERPVEKLAFAEGKGVWVSFDMTIDEDLKLEGLMRDLLRHLQVLRKQIGLEIEDRIGLIWESHESAIKDIFDKWENLLKTELLCTDLKEGLIDGTAETIAIGNARVRVKIKKV